MFINATGHYWLKKLYNLPKKFRTSLNRNSDAQMLKMTSADVI